MRLRPSGARVVVKVTEREELTKGGIFLPATAKERPQEGIVIAVGPGEKDDKGNRWPVDFVEGARVLYQKYSGTEFKLGDEEFLILSERDVLATVEE